MPRALPASKIISGARIPRTPQIQNNFRSSHPVRLSPRRDFCPPVPAPRVQARCLQAVSCPCQVQVQVQLCLRLSVCLTPDCVWLLPARLRSPAVCFNSQLLIFGLSTCNQLHNIPKQCSYNLFLTYIEHFKGHCGAHCCPNFDLSLTATVLAAVAH